MGAAAYAGLACTAGRYEDNEQNGEARIAADGVPVRGLGTRAGRTFGLGATRATYRPQDPARFRRPDGRRLVLPNAHRGGRRPAPPTAAPARCVVEDRT